MFLSHTSFPKHLTLSVKETLGDTSSGLNRVVLQLIRVAGLLSSVAKFGRLKLQLSLTKGFG